MGKIIKSKLFLILILASSLRLLFLAKVPPALNWDEVSMGYSAYSLSVTGADEWGSKMPLFFRSYGEWKSPVYIYLLVPFIKVFGLNAWGVRLPAAIAGILAVYLTYLIGKRLYGEHVGLWSAFFLTVSPWHLMLSRPGFEAGVALTAILAGIYFFLQSIKYAEGKQLKSYIQYSIFCILSFGLAPYTYNSAKIVVPIIVMVLLFTFRSKLGIKRMLLVLATLALMAVPMLYDTWFGGGRTRYGQVGVTTDLQAVERFYNYRRTFPAPELVNKTLFNKYTFFAIKSLSNWTSYLSPHFLLGSSSIRPQHSIPYRGVLYIAELFLVIYGIFALKKYQGFGKLLPLSLILAGFIPSAITKDPYHVLRSILTLPAWQLLAALGYVHLQKSKFPRLKIVNWLFLLEASSFILLYFLWYPTAFARDWQKGYQEVVRYVAEHQQEYNIVRFTKSYGEPHVFVAFYSQLDPRIFQGSADKLLDYSRLGFPWVDQVPEYSLGKYTFGDIIWDGGNKGTLYVGKGDDFWSDTPVLFSVDFPDGSSAFRVVEGKN